MTRSVLFVMTLGLTASAAVAHPGHEHAADRTLVEQIVHPAFGWAHYALFAVIAVAAVAFGLWTRTLRSER